ncbi:MFSD1 [Cordylochernes scorpioides]|uniref:MFSD1 n=1 Tax=Cordylochernes scorpioides TaxID=51811 RepID=A0ABY6KWW3_9ARAC|nr:MFSD1 [Cordylochernes scorpioides]
MLSQMGISTQQFASLYSWYSWPNVIICMIGGYLIDRVFGIRWGAIFFSLFILFGQKAIQHLHVQDALSVIWIGGESLQVSQNAYACKWFTDNQLNFIFGLQLSIGRVGSTINFVSMGAILTWVSNWFTGYQAIGMALYVGGCIVLWYLLLFPVLDNSGNPLALSLYPLLQTLGRDCCCFLSSCVKITRIP